MLLASFYYLLPAEFIIMQNTDHFRRFCAKNNIELVWWNANTRCKNKTKLGHFYEISGLKILLSPLYLQWVFIVLQRILQKKGQQFHQSVLNFPAFSPVPKYVCTNLLLVRHSNRCQGPKGPFPMATSKSCVKRTQLWGCVDWMHCLVFKKIQSLLFFQKPWLALIYY